MIKYIAVRVFVTDGERNKRKGAKIINNVDRLGSLPLVRGKTVFLVFCINFDNKAIGDKNEKSSYFDGKRQRPSHS